MRIVLYHLYVMCLAISRPFRKTYTSSICGHRTKRVGQVTSLGEKRILSLNVLKSDGKPRYCLDCIAKMSIKCAWCGNPIHIGDPITLYSPKDSYDVPEYAVRYTEDPKRLVGCLGWECADTGGDRSGFWTTPGVVARVALPIEMLMSGGEQKQAVVVQDLSDPNNVGEVV